MRNIGRGPMTGATAQVAGSVRAPGWLARCSQRTAGCEGVHAGCWACLIEHAGSGGPPAAPRDKHCLKPAAAGCAGRSGGPLADGTRRAAPRWLGSARSLPAGCGVGRGSHGHDCCAARGHVQAVRHAAVGADDGQALVRLVAIGAQACGARQAGQHGRGAAACSWLVASPEPRHAAAALTPLPNRTTTRQHRRAPRSLKVTPPNDTPARAASGSAPAAARRVTTAGP